MILNGSVLLAREIMQSSLSSAGRTVALRTVHLHPLGLDPVLDFFTDGGVSVEWEHSTTYVHILTYRDPEDAIKVSIFANPVTREATTVHSALEAMKFIEYTLSKTKWEREVL